MSPEEYSSVHSVALTRSCDTLVLSSSCPVISNLFLMLALKSRYRISKGVEIYVCVYVIRLSQKLGKNIRNGIRDEAYLLFTEQFVLDDCRTLRWPVFLTLVNMTMYSDFHAIYCAPPCGWQRTQSSSKIEQCCVSVTLL